MNGSGSFIKFIDLSAPEKALKVKEVVRKFLSYKSRFPLLENRIVQYIQAQRHRVESLVVEPGRDILPSNRCTYHIFGVCGGY